MFVCASLVFSSSEGASERAAELEDRGVEIVRNPGRDIGRMLDELGARSIQSVLVEGGANVAGQLMDARLVNKVTFFVAPKIVGGKNAPSAIGGLGVDRMKDAIELTRVQVTQRGDDLEISGYPHFTDE